MMDEHNNGAVPWSIEVWRPNFHHKWMWWMAACVILFLTAGVAGLRDVQVTVPEAVAAGEAASLQCRYDLEGDALYSVKWYKGYREFFRYIPKELPHTRVFPMPGANVDVSRSGPATVVLRKVPPSLSGKYRCEVSADAPSFHTVMKTSYMNVVELPKASPVIIPEKSRISIGDTIRVRCVSPPANPPANLTWFLNSIPIKGIPMDPDTIPPMPMRLNNHGTIYVMSSNKNEENNTKLFGHFYTSNDGVEWENDHNKISQKRSIDLTRKAHVSKRYAQELEVERVTIDDFDPYIRTTPLPIVETIKKRSGSILELVIGQESFHLGRLSLTCRATVFSLYDSQAHLILEGEKPQIASVLGTRESSSGSNTSKTTHYIVYVMLLLRMVR